MASTPQFAATPVVGAANLTATTACATRAPVATANLGTNNIIPLTAVSTSGLRIDSISVSGAATSMTGATTAGLVGVWVWDGTIAYLLVEIAVTAVTPSTTTPAFSTTYTPTNPIVLPPTHRLYVSTSVTTTAAANALEVLAFGGAY